MFNKIYKICTTFFIFIFITISTLTIKPIFVEAIQSDPVKSEDNSLGIVIEESTDSSNNLKTSSIPDLGDDQTFPFIPGFGKNSGKD